MKVQVEGNLYIESDQHQFIIKEYTGGKNNIGYENYIVHGYFANLKSSINHLVKMKIKESTATTLKELMQDVKRTEEYIHTTVGC